MSLAPLLLAVGASRHYLWAQFPPAMQGGVSKALGAAATLVLLWCVYRLSAGGRKSAGFRHESGRKPAENRQEIGTSIPPASQSKPLAWVLLWWAWEEAQTLLCGAAWAAGPWPVVPGQGICSGRLDFDLGAIGILIVAAIAMRLTPVKM